MTMAEMVDRLVEAGFDVEKVYDKFAQGYRFTISKKDCYTSALFEYPADTSRAYCDQKQREFIDFIINKWRKDHIQDSVKNVPISKELKDTICGHLMAYAVSNNIPCYIENDSDELRMWYAGPGPERGIVIVWPEVENVFELAKVVANKIDEWVYESKGENTMPTETERYIRHDITSLTAAFKRVNDSFNRTKLPGIKTVHFSGPCTIVLWEDGTKTIVRCNNDVLDPEKGLAMAIAKKALGTNKSGSNYYDIFKKWLPKEEEPIVIDFKEQNPVDVEWEEQD